MEYKITLNEETDKQLQRLGLVLGFLLEKDDVFEPEEIIKAALANYLHRYFDNLTVTQTDITGLNGNGTLHNKLKEYAKSRGISLSSLSEQCGISKSVLSKTFNNQTEPTLDVFIKIWIGVGCPPLQHVLYRSDD